MDRLEQIEKEIEILENKVDEKNKIWDDKFRSKLSWDEYQMYMFKEWKAIAKLDRERRMIMPYKLSELPNYGDVMSLNDFIKCVKCGGFIDYDGFGNYVKDGKETDIVIQPSDVKYKAIRKDFDTIIWYNR